MRKFTVALIVLLVVLFNVTSNAQGYKEGSKTLKLGIGFGLSGVEGDATIPPVSAGLQYGLTDKISIGGLVAYSGSTYKFGFLSSSYEWKYSYLIIGARGEYHFLEPSNKFDAYGGLTLGYEIFSVTEPGNLPNYFSGYSAKSSTLIYGFHVGGKYALSNSFGLFGELGYGISYVTVGVSIQL